MVEASTRAVRTSNNSKERLCKFGTVVLALWPEKPALNLAQRMGCTERAANFYITGKRKPSFDAILTVVQEMRS